mmetsp:Transcript_37720/g.82664  ORF Transcript_37720/g.82664 Transcript_37720/m.82664 type:complete len:134 (-) Transcript_37720:1650-2051(-)
MLPGLVSSPWWWSKGRGRESHLLLRLRLQVVPLLIRRQRQQTQSSGVPWNVAMMVVISCQQETSQVNPPHSCLFNNHAMIITDLASVPVPGAGSWAAAEAWHEGTAKEVIAGAYRHVLQSGCPRPSAPADVPY